MSRFSKAEAEKLGWSFYHDAEEVILRDGNNELGISKRVPASIRAEKFVDLPGVEATRTTEEAPSLGLLLERIHSFEQHLKARLAAPSSEADARVPDEEPAEDKQAAKQLEENARVVNAVISPEEEPAVEEPGEAPEPEEKPKKKRLRRKKAK